MQPQAEDVVLDKERIGRWLQHERLVEGVWWVVVGLELTEHGHQDAAIERRLRIDRGDNVLNLLESQLLKLLQDLSTAHQLAALERHQRVGLLRVQLRLEIEHNID